MALYKCDPRKHPECRGSKICQKLCFMTTDPDCSIDGEAMSEEEAEKFENESRRKAERKEKKNGRKMED